MKPTFPTHSHYGQREFFGRKWREYGRNRGADANLGKLVGESQVECHFAGFPQGRNYSGGIGDAWYPWKTKGGSCYNHKTIQKLVKTYIIQWQPNSLLFPLIPTKARTTKLAQKLEKHPKPTKNHVQPVGCWEEICLKILFWLFLILSDYVENCLNVCPSSARRETVFGRLRAAAYDHLRLARNRLYRYHFDGNYSIFPYGLMEVLEYFFLNSTDAGIILLLFWCMLTGVSP